RCILCRLTIGPIVQDRAQSWHIEYGRHFGVCSEALHLFGNMISLPRQPREPVSGLGAKFRLVEYDIRQPSFHRPPDQPAVTASVQILILWNPDAKLNQPPIKRRCPNIDFEPSPQLCKPVTRLTIIAKIVDSSKPPITSGRRVERQVFLCRPIDYAASSGKFATNEAKVVPRWISPSTPLLVPPEQRRRN